MATSTADLVLVGVYTFFILLEQWRPSAALEEVKQAIVANTLISSLAIFQHANIRTPRWLGLLVQRPEAHRLHHERGVHATNYGDLTFLDMLFGTFRNPPVADPSCGFFDGASEQWPRMLGGREVTWPLRSDGEVADVGPAG